MLEQFLPSKAFAFSCFFNGVFYILFIIFKSEFPLGNVGQIFPFTFLTYIDYLNFLYINLAFIWD